MVLGVNASAFAILPDQVYVSAPLPNKLVVKPLQTEELVTLALTVGKALTVTVMLTELVLIHPVAPYPAIVYVVVTVGVGVTVAPIKAPGYQEYVFAPFTDNDTE